MISGITTNLNPAKVAGGGATPASGAGSSGAVGSGSSFADTLKNSINDVAKLQQDATKAVQDLATGKTEDVTGVMTAVEKSDLAFKTLLSIRTKLMEAYDEIKGMSV
jgi:flagellar hook-basal body complex protein FliE